MQISCVRGERISFKVIFFVVVDWVYCLNVAKKKLTHISLASHFLGYRQTVQNAESDQGLHCLLTGISI